MRVMELTRAQRRTLEQLIGTGPAPPFDASVGERVRSRLDEALLALTTHVAQDSAIWLGKHRLTDRERCEGLFLSNLAGEGPPFAHSARTAAGAMFHKAMEVDIVTERGFDPRTVCERAAARLEEDGSFGPYWMTLQPFDRADLMAEAGRHLTLFRDSFPPLVRQWAPQPELTFRAHLAGGRVVLSGTPDLVLGRGRRLVLDFKSGRAWPDHAEDMRFYALLVLLRAGVAPYRVATFFLDSGEWQAEDVGEEMLVRACDRVVDSVRVAAAPQPGDPVREPRLQAGVWCGWCPRKEWCPAAGGRAA
jgi:hypothetical protein